MLHTAYERFTVTNRVCQAGMLSLVLPVLVAAVAFLA